MKILIYATAAEYGGSISILESYYKSAQKDYKNNYFFIIGKAKLNNDENINILRFDWIKKSYLTRLFFYAFTLRKILNSLKPDKVISLNNTKVIWTKVHQTIYLHQPLPFFKDYKPNFFKNLNVYKVKYIIGPLIYFSIKNVDHIIVQSKWFKNLLVSNYNISEKKIAIKVPDIKAPDTKFDLKKFKRNKKTVFIYPSGYIDYKNHKIIINALQKSPKSILNKVNVIFTIDENKKTQRLIRYCKQRELPIEFAGYLSQDKIYDYYKKSCLLFVSQVETFGLPLLEAKLIGAPIIALKTNFSKEILENYKYVSFINNEEDDLIESMKNIIRWRIDEISSH